MSSLAELVDLALAGAPASGSAPADTCVCGGAIVATASYGVCELCAEAREVSPAAEPPSREPQIRVAGRGQGKKAIQSSMFRSSAAPSPQQVEEALRAEFRKAYNAYVERHADASLPADVLEPAAALYYRVTHGAQKLVKRGGEKSKVMAGCLYAACLKRGLVPDVQQIANCLGIEAKAVAPGYTFLVQSRRALGLDLGPSPEEAIVRDLFARLFRPKSNPHEAVLLPAAAPACPHQDQLQAYVLRLVRVMHENNILASSEVTSQVAGAAFYLFRLLELPLGPGRLTATAFCANIKPQCSTVLNVAKKIDEYGGYFRAELDEIRAEYALLPR